jgi:hypothetical protein
MGSYSHKKKQSQTKFNPNQLITDSIYKDIPPYLTPKQLSHMGLTSKYLDKEKTFPSKCFLSQAKNILFPLKKRQTQSIPQYQQRLKSTPDNHSIGRQIDPSYLIPPTINTTQLLFPIRPLTYRQMNRINKTPLYIIQLNNDYQKYEKIRKYLFDEDILNHYIFFEKHLWHSNISRNLIHIINDSDFNENDKIQLCHLNNLISNYLISRSSKGRIFQSNRLLNIIKSLKSEIILPKHHLNIPPLTDEQIQNVYNVIEFLSH